MRHSLLHFKKTDFTSTITWTLESDRESEQLWTMEVMVGWLRSAGPMLWTVLLCGWLFSSCTESSRRNEPCSFPLTLRTTEWPWKILSPGKNFSVWWLVLADFESMLVTNPREWGPILGQTEMSKLFTLDARIKRRPSLIYGKEIKPQASRPAAAGGGGEGVFRPSFGRRDIANTGLPTWET